MRKQKSLAIVLSEMSTPALEEARPKVAASNDTIGLAAIDAELAKRGVTLSKGGQP